MSVWWPLACSAATGVPDTPPMLCRAGSCRDTARLGGRRVHVHVHPPPVSLSPAGPRWSRGWSGGPPLRLAQGGRGRTGMLSNRSADIYPQRGGKRRGTAEPAKQPGPTPTPIRLRLRWVLGGELAEAGRGTCIRSVEGGMGDGVGRQTEKDTGTISTVKLSLPGGGMPWPRPWPWPLE